MERPAEVLCNVPTVRERSSAPCHACLQCRLHTVFWEWEDTPSTLIRKLEAGDRNIYREYIAFCNYKGKTARHTAQTEKGGVLRCCMRHKNSYTLSYLIFVKGISFD